MSAKNNKGERRIYCKYCGAKLKRDYVGPLCPTHNCQWQHGVPDDDTHHSPRSALLAARPSLDSLK